MNRIIDLSTNGAEYFEKTDKIINIEAMKRLGLIIKNQINELKNKEYHPPKSSDLSYRRIHNGILIEGGRGSGKTTFLLNALHHLQNPSTNNEIKDFIEISADLQVLQSIDPTLIETKENIIIVIISLIDAALDDPKTKSNTDHSAVNDARKKMAEGLDLLDGIGKTTAYGDEWEDPEWIMSRGLRKARNGRSFEIKFQTYIYAALRALNKKAFVISFDDVDTNFQHGSTILEAIRKYLTSPQLVILISGDLELYGRLVRSNIYNTFGSEVMKHDADLIGTEKKGISSAVKELEEQYLLKIVPPQNRISMLSLGALIRSSPKTEIMVIPHGENQETRLFDWASEKIRNQLLENINSDSKSSPYHPFLEVVSREHLRLVISYLRAVGETDVSTGHRGVLAVFEARLRLSGINPLQLANAPLNDALFLAFRWLVTQDNPSSLARFGVPSDANKAIILHCLALTIAKELKGSFGNSLRTLLTFSLPISMMRRTELSSEDVKQKIFQFIWADASPDLLDTAGCIGAIARFATNEDRSPSIGTLDASCFGSVGTKKKETLDNIYKKIYGIPYVNVNSVITLHDLIKESISKSTEKRWINTLIENREIAKLNARRGVIWFSLENLTSRTSEFQHLLNLITYERFSGRGELFTSISAISLLAAITHIITSEEDEIDLSKIATNTTISAFNPKNNSYAPDKSDDNYDDDENDDESNKNNYNNLPKTNENEFNEFNEFINKLKNWKKFSRQFETKDSKKENKLNELSPKQLALIAERIHDQLLSLDDSTLTNWKTGHILHRQITNILHAIISITSGKFGRLESPKNEDRVLGEALRKATADKSRTLHPLAAIILSCPLVWAFLNPEEKYNKTNYSQESIKLRDEVENALTHFQNHMNPTENQFNPEWLTPPDIAITIGLIQTTTPRTVISKGFFDVLNVVPRYYPTSRATK